MTHGILQARILEWVASPFSRGSSQPRDGTLVSHIVGGFFINWATRAKSIKNHEGLPTAFNIKLKFTNKTFTFLHNLAPHWLFTFRLQNPWLHPHSMLSHAPHCPTWKPWSKLCFDTSVTLLIFFLLPRRASLVLFSLIKTHIYFSRLITQSINFLIKEGMLFIQQAFTVYRSSIMLSFG